METNDNTTKEIIKNEVQKIIEQSKESLNEIKVFALAEVWKLLQLLTAVVIQLIENLGHNLSSPEKKELAMEVIGRFYDEIFVNIKISFMPSFVTSLFKVHIKSIIMIFVSSGIDAMVTTFRQVGVFKPKTPISIQSNTTTERKVVADFLNNLNIVREA